MSELVGVVGATGSGKSTSVFPNEQIGLRGLEAKETFLISVAGKPLPLKGWKSIYTKVKGNEGNLLVTEEASVMLKALLYINSERPDIKNIVIDD